MGGAGDSGSMILLVMMYRWCFSSEVWSDTCSTDVCSDGQQFIHTGLVDETL